MGELKFQLDMIKKPVWKFVNATAFAKENFAYIQEAGRFCSGKNYYTKRSGLDSYLIKFTLSGKGVLEYCGEKYTLTSGSVMFIDCNLPQNYYTELSAEKWEMSWVHFYGKNIKAYYEKYLEKNNGSPVSHLAADNAVNEITENIINLAKSYSVGQDNEIIADNLINSLIRECIVKSGEQSAAGQSYINEIATYLRHHYSDEIDLDLLSDEFNVSKFHLQRTFKEAIGVSPAKYLTNVRIYRAKSLLRGTRLSVSEIAEQIGMESNYFIQLFKSSESETPLAYRNRWGGK